MRAGRYLIAAAVVALVAGGLYWTWGRGGEDAGGYTTEAVDRGSITSVVTATGTVNPVSTVQVGTYVSGPIRAIDVDFNSPVQKGQRVAKIDPAPFLVKVQRAEAGVANARARVTKDRADLELKRLTLRRTADLLRQQLVSQSELDTAESDHQQAQAQLALDEASIQLSQAELEEARINLAYTDITSPVDGVVVSRNVDVGQTVAASFQTPTLFLIAQDLTKMQVNASVSESDIGAVRQGQSASFAVDAYPGRTFQGAVVQVRNAPVTVQNVVTYDVVIAVDNAALELKPGMTATVTITAAERDDVLRVPVRALRFNPERKAPTAAGPAPTPNAGEAKPGVWVVGADDVARRVELDVGLRDERYAEVLAGALHAGDQVAVGMRRTTTPQPAARPPGMGGGRRF